MQDRENDMGNLDYSPVVRPLWANVHKNLMMKQLCSTKINGGCKLGAWEARRAVAPPPLDP
jgi:hypothetical protein